ncbi:MAG: leucyl aminopeptidase, partial [candidate division Zixibacteria bacterium]|nr:leucyl aminopeptidase [candidate division Zixibacteria bacterium]
GIKSGKVIAEGVIMARQLAAEPGNFLTPQKFASKANSLAKKYKFGCEILDEAKIKSENMGALLAVGQGSEKPSRVVVVNYQGGKKGGRPIVLVGKGITFDTGGISLKKAPDMDEMKGDMSGGGIVLSTVVTAARLELKQNIIGIIPLAENMPSGRAIKPGDIVTSRKGKTIEILNTDAEGRLILADALDYANEFNPKAVIDIATLTGATKYILGYAGIPYLGNNEKFIGLIKDASEKCGELVWHLPIWDEHREMMKSSIADLKNAAGPYSGTITATAFLENFIGSWPWIHIDIACVDIEKKGRPYIPKGQTGNGLRLLVEVLANWKKV